jgi:hypothetical protein
MAKLSKLLMWRQQLTAYVATLTCSNEIFECAAMFRRAGNRSAWADSGGSGLSAPEFLALALS